MTAGGDVADVLRRAPLRILGRFAEASNLTLLAEAGEGLQCVYKPSSGERPLWDFPSGTLGQREVAFAALCDLLGWDLVPTTVRREEGPFGPGVCQAYVATGQQVAVDLVIPGAVPTGWHEVAQGENEAGEQVLLVHRDSARLRRLALLDAVANNADRKGSHILTDADGSVWGIDHGLTFHAEDKLRTVLWGFAGDLIAGADAADLVRAAGVLAGSGGALAELLGPGEVAAARQRLSSLLAAGTFPAPTAGWPRLPWPAL